MYLVAELDLGLKGVRCPPILALMFSVFTQSRIPGDFFRQGLVISAQLPLASISIMWSAFWSLQM